MKHPSLSEQEEDMLTIREAFFSILYVLLKHFLLSILFLMAIWSLVKLPMTDEHLRRVIQREEDFYNFINNINISGSSPPGPSKDHRLDGHRFSGDDEEELVYQKLKVIVVMARIIVILVIFFGILGIIKENVNLLLVFVVFMSFRLLTTVYVPYFHSGLTANAALLAITLLSVIFSICLIHHKRQVACVSASTLSLSSLSASSSPVPSASSDSSVLSSSNDFKNTAIKSRLPEIVVINRA